MTINGLEMNGFGLLQNIGVKCNVFLGMFKNPMEIAGKIRERAKSHEDLIEARFISMVNKYSEYGRIM